MPNLNDKQKLLEDIISIEAAANALAKQCYNARKRLGEIAPRASLRGSKKDLEKVMLRRERAHIRSVEKKLAHSH